MRVRWHPGAECPRCPADCRCGRQGGWEGRLCCIPGHLTLSWTVPERGHSASIGLEQCRSWDDSPELRGRIAAQVDAAGNVDLVCQQPDTERAFVTGLWEGGDPIEEERPADGLVRLVSGTVALGPWGTLWATQAGCRVLVTGLYWRVMSGSLAVGVDAAHAQPMLVSPGTERATLRALRSLCAEARVPFGPSAVVPRALRAHPGDFLELRVSHSEAGPDGPRLEAAVLLNGVRRSGGAHRLTLAPNQWREHRVFATRQGLAPQAQFVTPHAACAAVCRALVAQGRGALRDGGGPFSSLVGWLLAQDDRVFTGVWQYL